VRIVRRFGFTQLARPLEIILVDLPEIERAVPAMPWDRLPKKLRLRRRRRIRERIEALEKVLRESTSPVVEQQPEDHTEPD